MKKLIVLLVALSMIAVLIFGAVQSFQGDFGELSLSTVMRFGKKEATTDNGWELILVNSKYSIPKDYEVKLLTLSNGEQVDERIYPELQKMFDDMRSQGVYPVVASGYRSYEKQTALLVKKYQDYREEGYSKKKASEAAIEWVAFPGTSEHQLGIAVDINPDYSKTKDGKEVYEWLENNSYKYGFVKRYADDKKDITGIINEPWHFRYVGKEAAFAMYEKNLCLEEYVELINRNK